MSSTGRGAIRHKDDYYVTPQWCILDALAAMEQDGLRVPTSGILDPASGGGEYDGDGYPMKPGAYPVALYKHLGVRQDGVGVQTVDIREDSNAGIVHDYLTWQAPKRYNLIITNPPFALAQEFIEKGLSDLAPGGVLVYLLRISFLESQKRKEWWQSHMPDFIYVHAKRPSFTEKGTDSCAYGHFVWVRDDSWGHPPFSNIRVI